MTREQVEAWAREGESETLELKKTTGERREGMQTLCAMLNHRGGRVVFGVRPDRKVAGQQIADRTLEELADEIHHIDPPAFPSVEQVLIDGDKYAIVVSTSQGQGRPYSYRGLPYLRVANTTREMSSAEYNRMLLERMHSETRWENQTAAGWTVDDLDIAEITRTLVEGIRRGRTDDPGTRDPKDVLRAFGLVKDAALLRAAAVLFGKPERLAADFPQCLLRVAKFKGTDKSEFLDNRQFNGNAFFLLARAEQFLRENLPIAGRVLPNLFEREDDPLYPPVALREALANAFCHRDYAIGGGSVALAIYDDRLEITSSGTLHFGLTAAALFQAHESLPWNPMIARVFYRRGVIEQWGRGTLKIAELTQQAGLPRPEIEDANGCVTVRFRPSKYIPPRRIGHDLSERQQNILGVLGAARAPLPLREILSRLPKPVSENGTKDDLQMLKELNLVANSGRGAGAKWRLTNPGAK
jgi:ATP-dependent DNA helicase RecG